MISTAEGTHRAMQMASANLQPEMKLTARETELFNLIATSRETDTWSGNDRMIASQLAKTYRRIEELNRMLDEEGYTQVNERGTQIANPKFAALTQLQSQVQSATRTLGLSASQRALTSSKQKSRNDADSRAREVIKKVAGNALLA
jgi:P27 family predicted phage terminase small subunit